MKTCFLIEFILVTCQPLEETIKNGSKLMLEKTGYISRPTHITIPS